MEFISTYKRSILVNLLLVGLIHTGDKKVGIKYAKVDKENTLDRNGDRVNDKFTSKCVQRVIVPFGNRSELANGASPLKENFSFNNNSQNVRTPDNSFKTNKQSLKDLENVNVEVLLKKGMFNALKENFHFDTNKCLETTGINKTCIESIRYLVKYITSLELTTHNNNTGKQQNYLALFREKSIIDRIKGQSEDKEILLAKALFNLFSLGSNINLCFNSRLLNKLEHIINMKSKVDRLSYPFVVCVTVLLSHYNESIELFKQHFIDFLEDKGDNINTDNNLYIKESIDTVLTDIKLMKNFSDHWNQNNQQNLESMGEPKKGKNDVMDPVTDEIRKFFKRQSVFIDNILKNLTDDIMKNLKTLLIQFIKIYKSYYKINDFTPNDYSVIKYLELTLQKIKNKILKFQEVNIYTENQAIKKLISESELINQYIEIILRKFQECNKRLAYLKVHIKEYKIITGLVHKFNKIEKMRKESKGCVIDEPDMLANTCGTF